MDVVVERCTGLDVHRDNVVVTVRVPGMGSRRWEQQTRTFRATLAGLADLGEWLSGFAVTLVGMEATGVYCKTVFQALEDLPDRRALRFVGRCVPWAPPIGRSQTLSTLPPRAALADRCADRVGEGPARTKGTYLAAHLARLRGRRGKPKAIGAPRHDILVAYYHIVRDEVPFRELGPDCQAQALLAGAPSPPPPAPARGPRLHGDPRADRTDPNDHLNHIQPSPSAVGAITAQIRLPNATINPGIHTSASGKRSSVDRLRACR
jgi:hypothetical protein